MSLKITILWLQGHLSGANELIPYYDGCIQHPRDPSQGIISLPPIHGITADNPSFTLQQLTTAAEKNIWMKLIYPIWQFYYCVPDNTWLFFMISFITVFFYDRLIIWYYSRQSIIHTTAANNCCWKEHLDEIDISNLAVLLLCTW